MIHENDTENVIPFVQPQGKPKGPAQGSGTDVVMALRQTQPEADGTVVHGVVAFDRRDPTMKLDLCRKETMDYVNAQLQHTMYHPELYGIGPAVLRCLNPTWSKHWAAEVLGLERADEAMKEALLAALLGTLATARGPAHLGTALFSIGSFIHAHPRFHKIRRQCMYEPPFGEHTEYTVCYPTGSERL
jgi:hypothetical protein